MQLQPDVRVKKKLSDDGRLAVLSSSVQRGSQIP